MQIRLQTYGGAIELKLFNVIPLPNDAQWMAIAPWAVGYYALGSTENRELVLIQKRWFGLQVNFKWSLPPGKSEFRIIPSPASLQSKLHVHIDSTRKQLFPPIESRFRSDPCDHEIVAGTLQQGDHCLGLTFSPEGDMWELSSSQGSMILKCYSQEGNLITTTHTASLFRDEDDGALARKAACIPMAAVDGQVFFAFRAFLCRYYEGEFAWLELPDAISELQLGVANGQPVLAAAMENAGVALVSCGHHWGVWEHHGADIFNCRIRFLHDGLLAVANTEAIEIYRVNLSTSETVAVLETRLSYPTCSPLFPVRNRMCLFS